MSTSYSERYKAAGVDITAGYEAVERMKPYVQSTFIKGVIGGIGGFGGLFQPDLTGIKEPVFVSGTDGVGTKLKIAFMLDRHDSIGIDCVAMCVNDVVCAGAKPLFFLDYLAVGRNKPDKVADIVKGVAEGCVMAGCALIGGETAEMPGFYPIDEYDLAGFCVGVADKSKITDFSTVSPGDVIIGLPSSGVHSNGFSLVRKVLRLSEDNIDRYVPSLNATLGDALLTPTVIYVKPMLSVMEKFRIKGASHITGGGFFENIPRMLPENITAHINTRAMPVPPIFELIAKAGDIDTREMYNTFNMGVGMAVAVSPEDADGAVAEFRNAGMNAEIIGECAAGEHGVSLI